MPRRFSTWFFAADLPPDVEPTFRDAEVVSHRWTTPAAALDELAGGASRMWVPTSSVLQQLEASGATSAAKLPATIAFGRVQPPGFVPEAPGVTCVESWSFGGVPGRRGTASVLGERSVVVVDPGDPSPEAVAAIESEIHRRSGKVAAIVLTAPDPDRAAGAEALAIPAEAPVLVAPGAGRHLPYPTIEVADGERVPADVDVRVRLGPAGSGRLEVVPANR
jgi:hypothetical protein